MSTRFLKPFAELAASPRGLWYVIGAFVHQSSLPCGHQTSWRSSKRSRTLFRCFLVAFAVGVSTGRAYPAEDQSAKPNIVLINCDDLGYGDLSCYGATKQRTPNIDRLAQEGIRFTSFYSTSGVCTPSRTSLMTGCYPRRLNMHTNGVGYWVLFPGNKRGLNPDEIAVAEVLRQAGYATMYIGKWHLGDQPPFLPTRQGFDRYLGMPLDRKVWGLQDVDLVRQPHLKRETPWDEIWHVAIVWLLRNPIVTSPIIGPRTMEQLTGSLRSLEVKLDAEALAKLDKIFPGPGGEAPEAYAW